MNRRNNIDEIAGLNTRLKKLQSHAIELKKQFFDYIEGLNSEYRTISSIDREKNTFEIFGNKLKLKARYNENEHSFKGIIYILMLIAEPEKDKYKEILSWKYDVYGNVKNTDESHVFATDDFAENLYIELMNKLIVSDNFEF